MITSELSGSKWQSLIPRLYVDVFEDMSIIDHMFVAELYPA